MVVFLLVLILCVLLLGRARSLAILRRGLVAALLATVAALIAAGVMKLLNVPPGRVTEVALRTFGVSFLTVIALQVVVAIVEWVVGDLRVVLGRRIGLSDDEIKKEIEFEERVGRASSLREKVAIARENVAWDREQIEKRDRDAANGQKT